MLRFALVGLGFISARHRKAIENIGGKVILTCDNDPEKQADFTDYLKMFHSQEFLAVDYVSVCTPNYTHSAIVREALRLGKKVICEKPLTFFGDYNGLEKADCVLQLRHNPKVKDLRLNIQPDSTVEIVVKTYREPKYWESWKGKPEFSGGILMNMGIHYLDLLRYLLGEPIEIIHSEFSDKKAMGEISFEKGKGKYSIEFLPEPAPVTRKIIVNGEERELEGATIPLSDTGEVLDLHTEVYKEILLGHKFQFSDVVKSLELAKLLKEYAV